MRPHVALGSRWDYEYASDEMTRRCCFVAARANAKFGMKLRKRRHRATLSQREPTKNVSGPVVAHAAPARAAGISEVRMNVDFFLLTDEQKASSMPGLFVTAESALGLARRRGARRRQCS